VWAVGYCGRDRRVYEAFSHRAGIVMPMILASFFDGAWSVLFS